MFDHFKKEMRRYDLGVHRLVPGAAPESIARAEAALGISFPSELRAFLSRWNGGLLFAKEFDVHLWHIDDPATDGLHVFATNIVHSNLKRMREFGQPPTLLAFAQYPDGRLACFDLTTAGRVVDWDSRTFEVEHEYDSLEDWLNEKMADGATLYDTHGDMLEP